MRSFKTISLLLAASVTIAFAAGAATATTDSLVATRRHLRVQHGGVDDHDGEVASDAGIPGYVKAVQPQGSSPVAIAAVPVSAPVSAPAPAVASAPVPQSQSATTPSGSTTTNVNVTPGTVNTNVNITPGTSTTTVNGVANPAPQAVAAQPRPATATTTTKPATSGLGFDSLNPLTMVATLAHQAHGMILGHTGTLPSSYMQGQSGGHGH